MKCYQTYFFYQEIPFSIPHSHFDPKEIQQAEILVSFLNSFELPVDDRQRQVALKCNLKALELQQTYLEHPSNTI